jgi:hypothetical protein
MIKGSIAIWRRRSNRLGEREANTRDAPAGAVLAADIAGGPAI